MIVVDRCTGLRRLALGWSLSCKREDAGIDWFSGTGEGALGPLFWAPGADISGVQKAVQAELPALLLDLTR